MEDVRAMENGFPKFFPTASTPSTVSSFGQGCSVTAAVTRSR
jgi:hypothetical protein